MRPSLPPPSIAALALLLLGFGHPAQTSVAEQTGVTLSISDEIFSDSESDMAQDHLGDPSWILEASLLQPIPLTLPSQEVRPRSILPESGLGVSLGILGTRRVPTGGLTSTRRRAAALPSSDVIFGSEAKFRVTTDSGNLLRKSPSALGIDVQSRSPSVSEPRVRGSRIGSLAASGSYWVPARIDLDTMTSKIDSRIVDDVIVIKGPYSVFYGPGFEFIDIQIRHSPRFEAGFEQHGSTSIDYKTNGDQVYGRQEVWAGDDDFGIRVGYGHRTGNDYQSGEGGNVPASYNSRDLNVAIGKDLNDEGKIEFRYLRLDQTNMELPGQVFDIDYLVTDAYEVEYMLTEQAAFDHLFVDAWYNRTHFNGNAQRPGKRQQFPFLDQVLNDFVGFTDVNSMSTGFRAGVTWGDLAEEHLTAGADLRYIRQELNESVTARFGLNFFSGNSPVPDSYSANPGVFAEYVNPVTDRLTLSSGARGDWVLTNVTDDPTKLAKLGLGNPQHSLAEILGSGDFDQSFTLWSGHVIADYSITSCWAAKAAVGYAGRPPNLTELYAAEPFMFLLQNGLNNVTGDPTLAPERRWQLDVGVEFDGERLRAGLNGFHAWIRDYVTFEATAIVTSFGVDQISLQYVNTDLATLAGAEAYLEFDAKDSLTGFATLQYVEGRDHSRNGDFATQPAQGGNAAMKVPGLVRGTFNGLGTTASAEPLPGIAPLEARLGVWWHEPVAEPRWLLEFSARIVDNQDRVASSLLERVTPGFTTLDMRGFWQINDQLTLFAGVENLTDRTYREHLDFRSVGGIQVFQPGVNFYLAAELVY